jgi:RHS repeat-associated protein
VTYPGGSIAYGYDDANRRASMTDATGGTTWSYDAASRPTSVAAPAGTISYTYDAAGRRATMGLPGGRTATYTYDPAGRLASVVDPWNRTVAFGYNVDGRRTSISRPNGVTTAYGYDAAGQLRTLTHANGASTLQGYTYTYDAAGNRDSVTTSAGTETYTFDALNRLTGATYPGGPTVSYTYDAAGNRTSETRSGTTTNYTYDAAGQMTKIGTKTYTYDANGNLTSGNGNTFGWDFDNRLTTATVGGTSATWTYDGDGVRTRATVAGATTNYLVDRIGEVPTVVDDGSATYLHADGLISKATSASATYALTDALGSIRGLSNASGTLDGSASWEAFGVPRSSSGTSTMFGFTGEPADATGLVYLRARTLFPTTGRMLSADTIRPNAPGSTGYNLYAYAADNPTTYVDPTGHLAEGTAQDFALFMKYGADAVHLTIGSTLAAEAVCQSTIGNVGLGGRTGCVDAAAAYLTARLFTVAMVGIGLAFACSSTPGCIGLAVEIAQAITEQGSTGTVNQLEGDPEEAPETHPSPPPIPVPLPQDPGSGVGTRLRECDQHPGSGISSVASDEDCDSNNALIGESRQRTHRAAAAYHARVWLGVPSRTSHSATCRANEAWLRGEMIRGSRILDIGIDTARLRTRSPYYALEVAILAEARYPVTEVYWPPSGRGYVDEHYGGPCPQLAIAPAST